MQYQFDVDIAKKYGVDEAVFVHYIAFWVRTNEANKRNCFGGKTWTYNSIAALTEIFPFWSARQIDRVTKSCKEKGLVETEQLSENQRDRTLWYTVSDEVQTYYQSSAPIPAETVKCISPNGEMETTERGNGFHETVKCIKGTNRRPNSNTDKKGAGLFEEYAQGNAELLTALLGFAEMRKTIKKPMTERAQQMMLRKLTTLAGEDTALKIQILDKSTARCWSDVYPPDEPRKADKSAPKGTEELDWLD